MKKLKSLIEEIIREELKTFIKEDEMDLAKQATPGASNLDATPEGMDDTENVDMSGGGLEDLAGDTTGTTGTTDGSTDPSTGDGTEGTDDTTDDGTDDFGGAGGGFGSGNFGGGGSSGGFESDFDPESPDDSESTDDNNDGTPDNLENPAVDPIDAVVGIAKDLRTKTGDAQQILNSVKAAIQERFNNYDDAATVIQLLWETGDAVLQVVARKLILFIKGN